MLRATLLPARSPHLFAGAGSRPEVAVISVEAVRRYRVRNSVRDSTEVVSNMARSCRAFYAPPARRWIDAQDTAGGQETLARHAYRFRPLQPRTIVSGESMRLVVSFSGHVSLR